MSKYQLAELNVALMKEPLESPLMADFVANLDHINTLAEQSPGFIWRLKDEEGNATSFRPFGDNMLVNMSTWKDVAALVDYAFKSGHVEVMRRRREWFERMAEAYVVLWWVPQGHHPSIGEAAEKLALLRERGPTADAFTFKQAFPAPDTQATSRLIQFDDACPAT